MTNLLNLDYKAMCEYFAEIGEKKYRASQVMKWIYHEGCDDFSKMTNLNLLLRSKLAEIACISPPPINSYQISKDGTIKFAIAIGKQEVESVYIPERDRATLCISSQVGCALECTFCSTATQGFNKNLTVSEIIGQVWIVAKFLRENNIQTPAVSNVVMMGMGEPLLNLRNVVPAMNIMLDDFGFAFSKRRVTLSTSGVVTALDKLGDMIDVALAISLHAPNDELRNKLVPVNKRYPIAMLLESVRNYLTKSKANKSKVTIEYVMLSHTNDSLEQAEELALLLQDTPCKINLIPFNHYPNAIYERSSNSRIDRFAKLLTERGYFVTVRKTRGDDIDAACGQLVGDVNDRTKRKINNQIIPVKEVING